MLFKSTHQQLSLYPSFFLLVLFALLTNLCQAQEEYRFFFLNGNAGLHSIGLEFGGGKASSGLASIGVAILISEKPKNAELQHWENFLPANNPTSYSDDFVYSRKAGTWKETGGELYFKAAILKFFKPVFPEIGFGIGFQDEWKYYQALEDQAGGLRAGDYWTPESDLDVSIFASAMIGLGVQVHERILLHLDYHTKRKAIIGGSFLFGR